MLSEHDLKDLFNKAQSQHAEKLQFTQAETDNFKKAFDDPEFRKMFAEYMEEMQDPKNREENEAYIRQLEGEQKVPEGKELIRPKAGFVAKTHKIADDKKTDKVFINIVSADAIDPPIRTVTKEGESWSLPYSLGPPHMERDKNDSNVPCFDCCFHPDAIKQVDKNKRFRDSLVITAIEGVEEAYKRQNQPTKLSKEFHVLKGVTYKSGLISTMMVDTATKNKNWRDETNSTSSSGNAQLSRAAQKPTSGTEVAAAASKAGADSTSSLANSNKNIVPKAVGASSDDKPLTDNQKQSQLDQPSQSVTASAGTSSSSFSSSSSKKEPLIRKGFLNSTKNTIYPESVSAKDKSLSKKTTAGDILLPGQNTGQSSSNNANAVLGNEPQMSLGATKGTNKSTSLVQEIDSGSTKNSSSSSTAAAAAAQSASTRTPLPAIQKDIGMTERSSTSRSKAVTDNSKQGTETTSTGSTISGDKSEGMQGAEQDADQKSKKPKYTLVERGTVSLGDFDSLRAKVAVNRPAELVCKIDVPLAVKPSQIVLDVSERMLKLTYPDTYDLIFNLPYPVFDKKGSAKYDKGSKTLTVVLPVQPPKSIPTLPSAPESTESDDVEDSNNTLNDREAEDKNKPVVSPTNQKSQSTNTSANTNTHSRWVRSEELEEERRRSEELAKTIKEQAEAARAQAQAQAQAQAKLEAAGAKQVSTSTAASATASSARIGAEELSSALASSSSQPTAEEDFMPCAKFSGKRIGFVFKLGVKGLGYYIDKRNITSSSSSSTASAPVKISTTTTTTAAQESSTLASTPSNPSPSNDSSKVSVFPFEYRQTKTSIAVLVQVPHIQMDSVSIAFKASSVEVAFRASPEGADASASTSTSAGASAGASGSQSAPSEDAAIINYSMKLHVSGGFLDVPRCKYDVAAKNMVLVLTKRVEGFWPDSTESPLVRGELLVKSVAISADDGTVSSSLGAVPELIKPCDTQPAGHSAKSTQEKPMDASTLSDHLKNMKFSTPAAAVLDLD